MCGLIRVTDMDCKDSWVTMFKEIGCIMMVCFAGWTVAFVYQTHESEEAYLREKTLDQQAFELFAVTDQELARAISRRQNMPHVVIH